MNSDTSDNIERRQTPRYEIKLPFDLMLDNGKILSVETRNISSCGFQMICDNWITDEIEPRGIQNHAISHLRLKAVIELPVLNDNKNKKIGKLYANCKIISVQRMSQDVYMLSLTFLDFENASERILYEFLNQYEQKKKLIKNSA